MQEEDHVE